MAGAGHGDDHAEEDAEDQDDVTKASDEAASAEPTPVPAS
jgi:hypothetical protein